MVEDLAERLIEWSDKQKDGKEIFFDELLKEKSLMRTPSASMPNLQSATSIILVKAGLSNLRRPLR